MQESATYTAATDTASRSALLGQAFNHLPLLIRERQLLEAVVPWHRSTLWAKVQKGDFPQPVRLGPGAVAWRREDVTEWYLSLREAA